MKITFVTGNKGKLSEVQKLISHTVVSLDIDLLEIQGTSHEIAVYKCKEARKSVEKEPMFVEDTCLCFDALSDLPGPYIKHFLKAVGALGLVKMLSGFPNKKASAVCTIAFSKGEGDDVTLFQGITKGEIVEPRGGEGFGWDSIFQPEGFNKTYAEMSIEEKNKISHRTKAVAALEASLATL